MAFLKRNCCDGIYNSSIDIRFTKMCDNRCSFCIEDNQGVSSLGKTNVDRMVKSVISGVEHEGKDTVLILGGEPFLLVKELARFVSSIRGYVKKIYITTSLPRDLNITNPDVISILDLIDGLNVSIHHWTSEKNNEILDARHTHNRIEQLKTISGVHNVPIRIQSNLVKGGIESLRDLLRMAYLAEQCRAELKFNELQDVGDDLYVSYDEIAPFSKLKNPYSHGCVDNVSSDYASKGLITVKRACFMVQEHSPHGASFLDLFKVIAKKFIRKQYTGANVIYENGLRSKGWLTKDSLIHKEKVN